MKKNTLTIFFLISLFFTGAAYADTSCETRCCEEEYPRLTVIGEGKIEVLADKAYFNVRIRAEEKKLKNAFEKGTERINSIQKALKSFNLKKEDIRNIGYVYRPLYQGKKIFSSIDRPSSYEVLYSLRVTMYDMDKLGKVLAELSEIEETTVFGVTYTVKNIEELKREVLKKAAQDARAKALNLAEGAGAVLGKSLSIESYIQEHMMSNVYAEQRLTKYSIMAEKAQTPQLESGYMEIKGACTIAYSIQ